MTKTATVDVPIEVRKTGPDEYQYRLAEDGWSGSRPESGWRTSETPGARAIVQAIDSGAFADPLPTATGVHVRIPEAGTFVLARTLYGDISWLSPNMHAGLMWHASEQVQSYGPFEVLYDPEAQS